MRGGVSSGAALKETKREGQGERERQRERDGSEEEKKDERKTKAEDVKLYRPVKDDQVLDVYCDVERREVTEGEVSG